MKKSIKVTPKKKRGRPATGRDPHVTSRMPPSLIAEVEGWAETNGTSRSDAFRRLVELGLASAKPPARRSEKNIAKAKELAATTIDHLSDSSAHPDEKASRKRRLLKGPEEFQDLRVDRTKKK